MTSNFDPIGGALPHSWRFTTIGELCDKNGGEVQTGPFGSQLHAEDYVADGVPSVMPKDIIGDRISTKSIARVPEKDAARLAVHRLRAGDVVYARRGDIGRRAIVTLKEEGWLCGTGCLRIRLNAPDVSPEYLLAYLGHPRVRALVESKAQGATMLNLNTTILRSVPLRVPSLPEQRRIADILDKADAIRQKRKEAIALTEELLRSAFLEMFGDPVTNPKGWEVKPLTELCESKQYGTAEKANSDRVGLPALRMNNLTYAGDIDLTDLKWVALSEGEASKLDLRDGDVLFNRVNSHELVGKTAAWHHGEGFTFAGYLIRLRLHADTSTGDYVSAAMNIPSMKRTLMAMAKPSINMANISGSDLARVLLPVPPLAAQRDYVALRETVDSLRKRYRSAESGAEALVVSLVQRAFRGELTGTHGPGKPRLGLFDAGDR